MPANASWKRAYAARSAIPKRSRMSKTLLDRASALLERRLSELEKNPHALFPLTKAEAAGVDELLSIVEVTRKIEKDRADLLLRAIGLRSASLTPEEVAKLIESYEKDPARLLGATEDKTEDKSESEND